LTICPLAFLWRNFRPQPQASEESAIVDPVVAWTGAPAFFSVAEFEYDAGWAPSLQGRASPERTPLA